MQSVNRSFHCTETIMCTVCSIDAGQTATVSLLALSTAFDTVDHATILLSVLSKTLWTFSKEGFSSPSF